MTKPTAQFATINGIKLYYKIHGSGDPLVLLHGGVIPDCFGSNVETLSKTRQLIQVHLQGHGHTPDVERPLRFESMAGDVAALIQHLGLGAVDVLGYSMGGGVALQLAMKAPNAVRRLIVVSQPLRHAAWFAEVRAAFDVMAAQAPHIARNMERSPLAAMYPEVRWEPLLRKIAELESCNFDWRDSVSEMKAQTLLVFADADAMPIAHIAEFYAALGGSQRDAGLDGILRSPAQLAIIPGSTHYNVAANPMLATIVDGFLSTSNLPSQ